MAPQKPSKMIKALKQPKSSYTDESFTEEEIEHIVSPYVYTKGDTESFGSSTESSIEQKAQYMRFGPIQLFNNFSEKQKF